MCNEEILKHMEEDMTFRGLAEGTKKSYIWRVTKYMEFHKGKDIEKLDENDVRDFLKHLFYGGKTNKRAINTYNSAIRFMYGTTLNKMLNLKRITLFKIQKEKPDIFTKEELKRFFDVCTNLKYRALFMTAYGGGLRVSELVRLTTADIDSKNMRIFIREGKEAKYRYTLLSQANLDILRKYYQQYRPSTPNGYLFPKRQSETHMTREGVEIAFRKVAKDAGITKKVNVHGLRHNFATDLMESGLSILQLQKLLGHTGIRSTMEYLHIANVEKDIVSPLDSLFKEGEPDA